MSELTNQLITLYPDLNSSDNRDKYRFEVAVLFQNQFYTIYFNYRVANKNKCHKISIVTRNNKGSTSGERHLCRMLAMRLHL